MQQSEKACEEVMCVRQQSLMQQAFAHKRGYGDAVSSTDTSQWSSPSRLCCDSSSPHHSSEFEDQTDSCAYKTPGAKSSDKSKKAQKAPKQKTNYTANHQLPKLPPIKPLHVSKPRIQSANLNCISELKSQVWDLQHQLSEAKRENKLLNRLQHRHTVALQHFQDSEGSISQILTKHNNEVRVLQGLIRETRTCRDNLARQLQATENKLLNATASLQRLQLLNHDHNLLEREELSLRMAKATAKLEEKDKMILDLKRNLELCQASFNHQITTEHRKTSEARKMSGNLQEQIYQLTTEVQDRERELEKHNIYSHRFLKRSNQKGRESKMVQTDGLVPLKLQHSETEERLEDQESCVNMESFTIEYLESEVSVNVMSEENHVEETETERCADSVEQKGCSEENPECQSEEHCTEKKEGTDIPQESEEEHPKERGSQVSDILEETLNTTEPKGNGYKLSKTKCNYTFKHSIENLHNGKPTCSSVDTPV
ncbi:lebercilin-like protein [Scomber japonicus]|uniref:lebercilin-like protein n=1 Tax=Scomber japonicus TaxID=13676 RepID=UPI002306CA7D|nr:lebercilin-like protein [Scomber japonicus]